MRRALPFLLASALVVAGCAPGSGGVATTKYGTLAAGTELVLSLLGQLEAGQAKEGDKVPLVVSQDVRDDSGNVLIPRGAVVQGEVSWSRSEGSLSGLARQPARLAIRVPEIRTPEGDPVRLVAKLDKPDEPFMFTRDNTGKIELESTEVQNARGHVAESAKVVALDKAEIEKIRSEIEAAIKTGEFERLQNDAEFKSAMEKLANDLELSSVRRVVVSEHGKPSGLQKAKELMLCAEKGTFVNLSGPEMALAMETIEQLGNAARQIDRKVSGMIKGRTIKAYMGTPVKMYVAETKRVKVTLPTPPTPGVSKSLPVAPS
jgi:hypothetical protein